MVLLKSSFLPDWLWTHARARPDAPALATSTARLSYGELATRVRDLADHFVESGMKLGDRILLALPNTPATVVAGLAAHAVGGTVVEVNREWEEDALADIVIDSGVHQAVIWEHDARKWANVFAKRPLQRLWIVHPELLSGKAHAPIDVAPVSGLFEDGRCDAEPRRNLSPAATRGVQPDSHALVVYTSGSTGKPRGVIQTFKNIDANTRSIVQYLGLSAEDRAFLVLPLYYCYGRSVLHTHLFAGGSIFLENRFTFPRSSLERLGTENCTGFAGVPLNFELIRRQVDLSTLSFPRLRYVTQAGGAMAPTTVAWVRNAFHPARLFVMYGQTEATARLSYVPPERLEENQTSIGIPIPGVELAIVDETGCVLPDEETGHLVARGDNVTPGYLNEPEETAAILRNGWLWTGDLAYRSRDGLYYLRGRSKEILKIGGHRVSPTTIEHVLGEHPDVAEAAVIGAQDGMMGEVPVAFVVPRPGKVPTNADIRKFCGERMPAYCVPITVHLVDALPRNQAGKLMRAELASKFQEQARC